MNAPRRSSYTRMPVAYAAIGASGAPDLMRFPPAGSTPYEEAVQLGSGQERFLTAANLLMTWGAHRAAGVVVDEIERGEAEEYLGVQFSEGGTPELGEAPEQLFSPEGEAYILPGTTATLTIAGGQRRPILVISTVEEPQRLGFAWGDREEVPGFGEQLITVEQRADGTVWAVARGFTFLTSSGLLAGRKQRSELRDVVELAQAFVAALTPGAAIRTGVVPAASDAAGGDAGDGAGDPVPTALAAPAPDSDSASDPASDSASDAGDKPQGA
ncbi:DUF1990 family protein [Leucobacter albus]|uniref:DUF1990 family protein n=1 Tax=Leucobacter albus TaxID=272210 RepID=A0ABW3TMV4_9MICO